MQTSPAQDAAYQTWEEICRAYPDEWVILFDMKQHPQYDHTIGGVVTGHSPIRKEALDTIPRDRPTTCGIFFTGKIRRRSVEVLSPD